MKTLNQQIVRNAQKFAARWGFLTKEIFFEFMCPMGKTQQYHYWKHLVASGLFVPSQSNRSVLLLSLKSRRSDIGAFARPSRFPAYIVHDAIAAKFVLTLEQLGMISVCWLEDELLRDSLAAHEVLGTDRLDRIPDVVFDLKAATGSLRCALEIERTVKTESRYSKIALAYLGYRNISITLFGCGNSWTENAVRRAFQGKTYSEQKRIPGLYQYQEFEVASLQANIRFGPNQMSIKEFVEIATKRPLVPSVSIPNQNRTSVRFKNNTNGEAA